MFGFGYKRVMEAKCRLLGEVLEHVGVHPAEYVLKEEGLAFAIETAENVLLRQAEEIIGYQGMVADLQQGVNELAQRASIAERNLTYMRRERSADVVAYNEALRDAGREKGELSLRLDAANRELNEVLDLLIELGHVEPVVDGDEVDLPTLLRRVFGSVCLPKDGVKPAAVVDTQELTLRQQAQQVQLAIAAVARGGRQLQREGCL